MRILPRFYRLIGSFAHRFPFGGVLLVVALGACGTGPEPLAPLAGRWEATSMVLTSEDDPSVSADIIQDDRFSAVFILEIEGDGRYEASLTVYAMTERERGTVEVDEDRLIFDPVEPEDQPRYDAQWELDGDTLILDGDTRFDFNRDGSKEPATLHIELERA